MSFLARAYRIINALSIDVAVGAVICAVFFSGVLNVSILPYGLLGLGLSVWIIYTTDHLVDAWKISHPAASVRHALHQKFFWPLVAVVFVACVINVVILFYVRDQVLLGGILLLGVVLLYLSLHHYVPFLKEGFVAALYTLGVLLPSIAVINFSVSLTHVLLIAQFFILALINLLLFSMFDSEIDKRDSLRSFVTCFGLQTTRQIVLLLFAVFTALSGFHFFFEYSNAGIILLVMALVLLFIFLFPMFFKENDRFRLVGDAVFLLPALQSVL